MYRKHTALAVLGLALMICVCIIPCEDADAAINDSDVASIGDTGYSTLQAAVDAAPSTSLTTIIILKDVTESITIGSGKNIIIDLGGHTITNASNHTITNNGTLAILDSSSTGTGTVDNITHARGAVVNYGTFTLESGKLTRSAEAGSSPSNNGGNSWYVVDNQGAMTVNGGEIVSTGKYSSLLRNYGGSGVTASLVINGGVLSNSFIAVKNDDASTLRVTGGTISSDEQSVQNWTTAEITGGTFNGSVITWSYNSTAPTLTIGGDAVINGNVRAIKYIVGTTLDAVAAPEVTITGGTITGYLGTSSHNGSVITQLTGDDYKWFEVTGGTFSDDSALEYMSPDTPSYVDDDGNLIIGSNKPVNIPVWDLDDEDEYTPPTQTGSGSDDTVTTVACAAAAVVAALMAVFLIMDRRGN